MKPKTVLGLSGGVDPAVADTLGMDLHVMDISRALEEHVKAPFAADCLNGHTP